MSFLDRALKNAISKGISDGLGQAVSKAAEKVIAPKAEALAGAAAKEIDAAAQVMNQSAQELSAAAQQANTGLAQAQPDLEAAVSNAGGLAGLESALNMWAQSAQNFANEAAKNMKICPSCGTPATADQKFCPKCGAKLPEETLGQGVLCPNCGKQNLIGTVFCSGCGTKLPAAVASEKAMLAEWAEKLPQYPVWNCGGTDFRIEVLDGGFSFDADMGSDAAGKKAAEDYRALLKQNGFKEAGQYPTPLHLYKKVGADCYHVDTEHCFEGSMDHISVLFDVSEPLGGFDYVKPQPKAQSGLGLSDLKDGLNGLKGLLKH